MLTTGIVGLGASRQRDAFSSDHGGRQISVYMDVKLLHLDDESLICQIQEGSHEAFATLEKKDMVIGPAADGGYYLIGFRKTSFNKNIFMGIPWGTEIVFETTIRLTDYEELSRKILPVWQDIDTFDDLQAFYQRCKEKKRFHLKTMQYLCDNPKIMPLFQGFG